MPILNLCGYDVLLDNADFEKVRHIKWYLRDKDAKHIYFKATIGGTSKYLHRYILDVTNSKDIVDHIDHNTLNNMRYNLRICTNRDNLINRSSRLYNRTGYIGVKEEQTKNYGIIYYSSITVNGVKISLGSYHNKEGAAYAYDIAALYHNGPLALLNFPKKNYNSLNVEKEYYDIIHTLKFITNTSGYRGVSWSAKRAKWTARIVHNYKQIVVGFFNDKIDAAKAYDAKAKELGKPKYYLNFPDGST